MYSPQIVTTGPDHSIVHLFALMKNDTLNLQYQENIYTVVYSRSSDGMTTWDPLHQAFYLEDYFGFSPMALKATASEDGTLAFVVGDYLTDLILMKSTDGGENWEKTIVVEHPFPFLELGVMQTDPFWTHTGSMDVKLDSDQKAHVSFSLCHIASDTSTIWYYDPLSDGIVYWHEEMETFSSNSNALNPFYHPDSELIEDYNLVAWTQDVDGNGTINLYWDNPVYEALGISTLPTLYIDEWDRIFLVWSSITETYDMGAENYRHLWARFANENGDWSGFNMLTNDLIHIFDECVFPVLAPKNNDEHLHLIYQFDVQPGPSIPEFPYSENNINYMKVPLEIIPSPFAIANFEADQTEIVEGDTVQFINYSLGYPNDDLTYQWEFQGGIPTTSTETNPAVIYPNSGSYYVELTASVSASVYDVLFKANYIVVAESTGIENKENAPFQVYPNPSEGKFVLSRLANTVVNYEISDMWGKVVSSGTIESNQQQLAIDLSQQSRGIYLLSVNIAGRNYSEKIVVK